MDSLICWSQITSPASTNIIIILTHFQIAALTSYSLTLTTSLADQLCTTLEVEQSSSSVVFNERLDVDNIFVPVCMVLVGVEEIGTSFTVEMVLDEEFSTATLGEDLHYNVVIPGSPPTPDHSTTTSIFITFATGTVMRSCGVMTILADDILEGPETYVLTLDNSNPFKISVNQDRKSFTLTISNDPSGKYIHATIIQVISAYLVTAITLM